MKKVTVRNFIQDFIFLTATWTLSIGRFGLAFSTKTPIYISLSFFFSFLWMVMTLPLINLETSSLRRSFQSRFSSNLTPRHFIDLDKLVFFLQSFSLTFMIKILFLVLKVQLLFLECLKLFLALSQEESSMDLHLTFC